MSQIAAETAVIPIPTIIYQLEAYRAARLKAEAILSPINGRLARRMGLSLGELKGHIAAGELRTILVGRAARMVDEVEARRFTEARGGQLIPPAERSSYGAWNGG